MIVDDNAEVRALIRSLLSDLAEEMEDYADGESAIANYDKHRPDWSLVDVRMPGMDGFAVTSWITKHDPEARVVVMCQNPNPQTRAVAFERGASAFVPKENLLQLRSVIVGYEKSLGAKGKVPPASSEPKQNQDTKP